MEDDLDVYQSEISPGNSICPSFYDQKDRDFIYNLYFVNHPVQRRSSRLYVGSHQHPLCEYVACHDVLHLGLDRSVQALQEGIQDIEFELEARASGIVFSSCRSLMGVSVTNPWPPI